LKLIESYDGHLQSPENIAKSVLARTGLKQSEKHAHHSRTICIGRKLSDEHKSKLSASQIGVSKSEAMIKAKTITENKKAFDKELPIYLKNKDIILKELLVTGDVIELLGISKMTITRRIKNKHYPNAYVGGGYKGRQPWLIPVQDIHDYYLSRI